MKYAGTILQDTVGYDIDKIYGDLFLSQEEHDDKLLEGIQEEDLNKIGSESGDKKVQASKQKKG